MDKIFQFVVNVCRQTFNSGMAVMGLKTKFGSHISGSSMSLNPKELFFIMCKWSALLLFTHTLDRD